MDTSLAGIIVTLVTGKTAKDMALEKRGCHPEKSMMETSRVTREMASAPALAPREVQLKKSRVSGKTTCRMASVKK